MISGILQMISSHKLSAHEIHLKQNERFGLEYLKKGVGKLNIILHEFLKVKGKVRSFNDVKGLHDI